MRASRRRPSLDAQSRDRLWQYLHRLRSERELTLIITTHYIEEVEGCDRVCVIENGKVLPLPADVQLAPGPAEVIVLQGAPSGPPERWPDGFFDAIHIDDPMFVRPEFTGLDGRLLLLGGVNDAPENFTHFKSSSKSLPVATSRIFHSSQSDPAVERP